MPTSSSRNCGLSSASSRPNMIAKKGHAAELTEQKAQEKKELGTYKEGGRGRAHRLGLGFVRTGRRGARARGLRGRGGVVVCARAGARRDVQRGRWRR